MSITLRLTIRHIAIISVLLAVIASAIFTAYNAHLIRQNNLHRAQIEISNLLQLRAIFLFHNRTLTDSNNHIESLAPQDIAYPSLINAFITTNKPTNAILLPQNQILITLEQFENLLDLLQQQKLLTLYTPINTGQYLVLQARYFQENVWENLIPILATIATMFILLWLC